jgi:hypothetical protein
MKIETKTTIRVGAGKEAKYLPPGEHDVDDAVAKDLIKRGKAVAIAKAGRQAESDKDDGRKPQGKDGDKSGGKD